MFSTADTGQLAEGAESDFQFALRTEGLGPKPGAPMRPETAYRLLNDSYARVHHADGVSPRQFFLAGKGKHKCIAPVTIVTRLATKVAFEHYELKQGFVESLVRCRKCDPCRAAKAALWKLRAMDEIQHAPRTWFVTLTFTPDQQAKADYAARLRLAENGVHRPTGSELFAARFEALSPDVTTWLKRVRKRRKHAYISPNPNDRGEECPGWDTAAFRYLMVAEEHESGLPHVHLLVHEISGQTLTKRRLLHTWVSGYANAKLVGGEEFEDDGHKAAAYVCKYISKSMLARVRSSHGYGVNF